MTATRVPALRLICLVWCLFVLSSACGAATIIVGEYGLLPDRAGQIITLTASGDELVRGMNIRAQIGDGLGTQIEPVFDGVDFGGGLWDAFANTTLGGPVNGAPQFMQASVVFNETGQTVRPDGVIARLSISTAGITSGSYALRLADTQIDEDTDFIRVGGSPLVPLVTNGTLRIIPEPSTAILAVLACLGACSSRRARQGQY